MTEAAMPPPPLMPTGPMPAAGPTGPMPTGGKRAAAMRARVAGRREPQVGDAPRLVEARRQMADEAAELRGVHDAPDSERARLLADLATRIDALLAWLGGERAADQLTGLAELVGKLRACDRPGAPRGAELDALWQEAIRVLTGFAGGADRGAPREWWKRTR